ncbi:hypothetical protein GCM10008015_02440 [Flavobacterium palustre]|uniref:CarboxypepD_reg-like domain-containing protein n=1 Tax=Flavobacterium palustre TaxID=1476463 RepID=A0ABQ1HA41_9FLAO|nr:hypothetical protein [Flavobacterium palustre]GGA65138.1 hypothetical protein GCM10008015_02440 [Flavobacterium palustre]
MKVKLLGFFLFITSPFIFSQTIKGKIVCNSHVIPKVDVVNTNSKTHSISDANGYFSIVAKMNDTLVFITKNYELKKIIINTFILNNKDLSIELILKAEELKEVVITKTPSIKLSKDKKWEQGKLDKYALEKAVNTPKVIGVNMGTIENGIDFIRMGKDLFKMLKLKKEPAKKENSIVPFKEIVATNFDQKFYTENLKLKKEEIETFLTFCDFDPESKKMLSKNSNDLELMDFLYKKSVEFKKINAPE